MKETRSEIIKARMPYSSVIERWLIKPILFCFKNLILVEDEENLLQVKDPVIFAFNHNTSWETILVSFYLIFRRAGKKISFVIDWMYGKLPILGWVFSLIDPVYVYNKKAKIAAINRHRQVFIGKKVYQECVERLQRQQSIGIFPEGTRNPDPLMLKRGRKGVGAMVLASGAAVVPIGIHYPRGTGRRWLPLPETMILRIGKPLDFAAEFDLGRHLADNIRFPGNNKRGLTLLAARITHGVMEALAGLSGKQYPYPVPEALPQLYEHQYLKVPEELCQELKPAKF